MGRNGAYMYVSVYVCIYIHVYKYIYIHLHKYTYYMYIYLWKYMYKYMFIYLDAYIQTHRDAFILVWVRKEIRGSCQFLYPALQMIIRYMMWVLEPTTKPSLHSQLSLNFLKINLRCNRFHYCIFIILCFGLFCFILFPPFLVCPQPFCL